MRSREGNTVPWLHTPSTAHNQKAWEGTRRPQRLQSSGAFEFSLGGGPSPAAWSVVSEDAVMLLAVGSHSGVVLTLLDI